MHFIATPPEWCAVTWARNPMSGVRAILARSKRTISILRQDLRASVIMDAVPPEQGCMGELGRVVGDRESTSHQPTPRDALLVSEKYNDTWKPPLRFFLWCCLSLRSAPLMPVPPPCTSPNTAKFRLHA
jgi:hypothetical protein